MTILNRLRNLAFVAASLNIVLSPLAVAAKATENNVTAAKEFLKKAGLNKGQITVGEYYRNILGDLTPAEIAKINPYFLLHQDEQMPSIDPVMFKDKNNVEQVRLAVTLKGKTYSFQTEGSGDTLKLKMNSYAMDANALENLEVMMEGIAKEMGLRPEKNPKALTIKNLKLAPTFAEWSRFSKEQKVQFLILSRYLIEDIQKILPVNRDPKSAQNESYNQVDKYALIYEILNPEACAGNNSKNGPKGKKGEVASGRCIVAGYVTEYGRNGSCGGQPDGRLDLDAQQNKVKPGLSSACPGGKSGGSGISCNPLFYGYSDSGGPYCISGAATRATEQCNGLSVLRRDSHELEDIKKILGSYLKDKNGSSIKSIEKNITKGVIEIGTGSEEDYKIVQEQLAGLDQTFREALDICEAGEKTVSMDSKINKPSALMKKENQKSACNAIVKRYIAVQQLQLAPTTPPRDIASDTQKRAQGDGCPTTTEGNCACSVDGARVGGGPGKNNCGALGVGPEAEVLPEVAPPKKEAGFCRKYNDDGETTSITTACGLAGVALIGLLGYGLYKYFNKDKKTKQKRYDPAPSPVTVPATGTTNPTPTPTAPPIVENPPIVPVPLSEGSGSAPVAPTPTGGGARKLAPEPGAR